VTSEPGKGPFAPSGEERRPFVSREDRDQRRRAAIESLTVGEWREGRVTSTTAFGAFVNLGEVDGLIHISQLGEGGYVARVEDVVTVGQTVRVRVVEVIPERGRVSLSMREAGATRPTRPAGPRPEGVMPRPAGPRPEGGAPRPFFNNPPVAPLPAAGTEESPGPDRRPRTGRQHADRGGPVGRGPSVRRDEERQRAGKRTTEEEDTWRDLRGGTARDYAYFDDGGSDDEEPAPQSAEELVARFSRRDDK